MPKQMCPVPQDSGLAPIFGSSAPGWYQLVRSSLNRSAATHRRRERFGDISYTKFFGRICVLPTTPQAAEQVIMNKEKAFANGPAWDFLIGMAFKRGLLLMDFDEHRSQRRIFQQAFTPASLEGYLQEMQTVIGDRMDEFPTGDVRLATEFKKILLGTALQVFVGVRLSRSDADVINGAFLDCLGGTTAFVRHPIPGGAWRRSMKGREKLESFFYEWLPEKRRSGTPDLFSTLCHAKSQDGDTMTDQQIVDHMIFLLFAAHDTSTAALSTMAYYMAKFPQWQQRARAESLQLSDDLCPDTLGRLSCLDLIFKESLRLNAPVPVLSREALRDTELSGYFIPKGTLVFVEPEAIHSNPRVWNNPAHFDPERFTRARAEDKGHRFAWFPFGAGVHKCIGLYFAQMEIKTVMHRLLRRYEWSVADSYEWRLDPTTLSEPKRQLPATVSLR